MNYQQRRRKRNKSQSNLAYIKSITENFLIKCSFCPFRRIKTNKNFYIYNRHKASFWNKKYNKKQLICYDCLFDWKEIELDKSRINTYRKYKSRYYKIV